MPGSRVLDQRRMVVSVQTHELEGACVSCRMSRSTVTADRGITTRNASRIRVKHSVQPVTYPGTRVPRKQSVFQCALEVLNKKLDDLFRTIEFVPGNLAWAMKRSFSEGETRLQSLSRVHALVTRV